MNNFPHNQLINLKKPQEKTRKKSKHGKAMSSVGGEMIALFYENIFPSILVLLVLFCLLSIYVLKL